MASNIFGSKFDGMGKTILDTSAASIRLCTRTQRKRG